MKKNHLFTENQITKKINYTFIIVVLLSLVKNSYAQLPLDSNGWTIFTPHNNNRIIYVSSSSGNDATAQNYSASSFTNPFLPSGIIKPYKTIAAAKAQMRDGYGDWMLLCKGDEWHETFGTLGLGKNGFSPAYPTLYGSYGNSALRPVVKMPHSVQAFMIAGGGNTPTTVSNYAIVGIEIYASYLNPSDVDYIPNYIGGGNDGSIFIIKEGANILIENFHSNYAQVSIFGMGGTLGSGGGAIKNLKFRRNVISNAYSTDNSHAQGVYIDHIEDTLLFEENVFYHNGYHDTVLHAEATMFNHNMYLQYNNQKGIAVVKNNIIASGASHGVQLRSGGLIKDNLFARNSLSAFIKHTGKLIDNVDIETKDITAQIDRGEGFALVDITDSASMSNNLLFKTYNSGVYNDEPLSLSQDTMYNTKVSHNTAFSRGAISLDNIYEGKNIIINKNLIQHPQKNQRMAQFYNVTIDSSKYKFRNNIYASGRNPLFNFTFNNTAPDSSFIPWHNHTGDNSTIQTITFDDTTRNLATYHASIGGVGTYEAFMKEACKQSKDYWRPEYMPLVVNKYLRKGYCSNLNKPTAQFTFNSSGVMVHFFDNSTSDAVGIIFDINSWEWNFGDGITSNLKNPTHSYSNAGTYTVSLIVANDCRKDTITKQLVVFSGVGINEQDALVSRLNIYPNPSNDFITIEYDKQPEMLILYNSIGEIVLEKEVVSKTNTLIQLQQLQVGVYVVGIVYKQGTVFKKIIKI